jgi:hypothetical protein
MRDSYSNIQPVGAASAVKAVTDNTTTVSAIVDTVDADSLTFLVATGTLADADATFATTIEHGDDSGLSDAEAVPAAQLLGTTSGASFTFADDGVVKKIGYVGSKRYVRVTVTPSANTGSAPIAIVPILGHLHRAPA